MFRVMREKCSTCIFHPDNRMDLRPGRLADITRETDRNDSNVICHKSQGLMGDIEGEAFCRGSVDRRPGQTMRIAERLRMVRLVDEPAPASDAG